MLFLFSFFFFFYYYKDGCYAPRILILGAPRGVACHCSSNGERVSYGCFFCFFFVVLLFCADIFHLDAGYRSADEQRENPLVVLGADNGKQRHIPYR